LLAYMPFHIFLSQSLSLLTGGLDEWKIGKDIVLAILCLFTICLVWWRGKATRAFNTLIVGAIVYGFLHILLWILHPHLFAQDAMLGTIYNVRLPLCLIAGFGAVLLVPKFAFSSVLKLVIIISTVVSILGIAQYFLPSDLLTHFGYSIARGARPAFFIDDNPAFPRIMSTLREPNALGAYLILPAAALAVLFFEVKRSLRKLLVAGVFGLHVVAIILTSSRSAWLAAALAIVLALWWHYKSWVLMVLKRFWPVLVGLVVVCAVGGYMLRDSSFVHQYIVHSNQKRTNSLPDSNGFHTLLVEQGLKGIAKAPFGHGPGTAGLVSIHDPNGGQLTENYYVQIGYEVGIPGLALFIALNAWLYLRIWRRKDLYAFILCASFWAYVLTNMLLHTWSNEAVAVQWWILAGMALVVPIASSKKNRLT